VRALVEPMLAATISPTMIRASRARNVIPALCEVPCDCRILPGQSWEAAEAEVRDCRGEGDSELELIESVGGTRSSLHTPLWEAIAAWVEQEDPGAALAPVVLAGFTGSPDLAADSG